MTSTRLKTRIATALLAASAACAAALAPAPAHAQDAAQQGAGQPKIKLSDLKFYTPDQDFKPITPAPWVVDGVQKVFLFQIELPGTRDYLRELKAQGVTVVHTGGPDPYWPLLRDDANSGPPAEQRATLRDNYKFLRELGMKIVIGISPYAPAEYVKQHPEWRLKGSPDEPLLDTSLDLTAPANVPLRSLSLNTPYGDYLIENIVEMMQDLDFDGISFDGNYHPFINYTPYDMELFRKETGLEFPKAVDLGDINYRVYMLWAHQKLEDWYRKLHEAMRKVNPNAATYTWTTNAGRYGHFLTIPPVMSARMNMLFDAPVQEWWLDEVNLGASVVPAFGAAWVRAVAGGHAGASEPYIMSRGNPYSSSNFPQHELFVRCMMAMANGSITPLALPSMAGKAAGDFTMEEIGRRKPWFAHSSPEPWAALLVSEQTKVFYAYQNVMERFLSHALGAFRVGWEEHLPITLITDGDVTTESLAKYKVLILPNAAALSDRQVDAIRGYVREGGGLVASCETSICDELGQPRGNFALADLFGVDYQGRPGVNVVKTDIDVNFARSIDDSYWAKRVGNGEMRWGGGDIRTDVLLSDPRLQQVNNGIQASFKGPSVLIPWEARAPMERAMMMFPENAEPVSAATAGTYGKGRVVYFAAGFDAANYTYQYSYQRIMYATALRWAASAPPPVEVEAPMCIQATLFRQQPPVGNRIVVHLFNNINTSSDHGAPENDVPLREEAVPVAGIKVRFRGVKPTRVHLQPENIELSTREENGELVVDVPPVAVHSMVVGEL